MYNKKLLKVENAKAPTKPKDIIHDQNGQRTNPGQITRIQGNTMATDGYGIPLYVVPDVGSPRFIQPDSGQHHFPGASYFTEYPVNMNLPKMSTNYNPQTQMYGNQHYLGINYNQPMPQGSFSIGMGSPTKSFNPNFNARFTRNFQPGGWLPKVQTAERDATTFNTPVIYGNGKVEYTPEPKELNWIVQHIEPISTIKDIVGIGQAMYNKDMADVYKGILMGIIPYVNTTDFELPESVKTAINRGTNANIEIVKERAEKAKIKKAYGGSTGGWLDELPMAQVGLTTNQQYAPTPTLGLSPEQIQKYSTYATPAEQNKAHVKSLATGRIEISDSPIDLLGPAELKAALSMAKLGTKALPKVTKEILNTSFADLPKPTTEQLKNAKGFLPRRQFIKNLQAENLIGKKFDVRDLNYAARSEEKTDALTKLALDRDGTWYRGVQTNDEFNPVFRSEGRNFDLSKPGRWQDISEMENMKKAGVDFNNPLSVGQYQATHVPLEAYGYRSTGLADVGDKDFLFMSKGPSSYGNQLFKLKSQKDFSTGNYQDWYNKYYKNKEYAGDLMNRIETQNPWHEYISDQPRQYTKTFPAIIGKRGEKVIDIDPTWEVKNYKADKDAFRKLNEQINNEHATGWRGQYEKGGSTGGWLDQLDDYERGGSVKRLSQDSGKSNDTSKNIKSSINKIMLRNYDVFGPGGKHLYNPKSLNKQSNKKWLDNLK